MVSGCEPNSQHDDTECTIVLCLVTRDFSDGFSCVTFEETMALIRAEAGAVKLQYVSGGGANLPMITKMRRAV